MAWGPDRDQTASEELMTKFMAGKCKPFTTAEWPDTVVQGFNILEQNKWVPCATLIMGLPGETDGDVTMTNELVDRLRDVRSLIVPLFFVSTGELNEGSTSFKVDDMTRAHNDLFLSMLGA